MKACTQTLLAFSTSTSPTNSQMSESLRSLMRLLRSSLTSWRSRYLSSWLVWTVRWWTSTLSLSLIVSSSSLVFLRSTGLKILSNGWTWSRFREKQTSLRGESVNIRKLVSSNKLQTSCKNNSALIKTKTSESMYHYMQLAQPTLSNFNFCIISLPPYSSLALELDLHWLAPTFAQLFLGRYYSELFLFQTTFVPWLFSTVQI